MLDSELTGTLVKATPPLMVTGGYFLGISWQDWVLIATFIYTCLQIGDWVFTKIKLWRAKHNGNA